MRVLIAAALALALAPAAALAQPSRTPPLPRPPDSGAAVLAGIDAAGFSAGAGFKLGDLSLDATAGFYPIVATLTTAGLTGPDLELAASFMLGGRLRYLPIKLRGGAIGGSVALLYNTVLDLGASVGPEAEIYLRDAISLRVGSTLSVFPDGNERLLDELDAEPDTEINFPFGGDVDVRTTIGVLIYL